MTTKPELDLSLSTALAEMDQPFPQLFLCLLTLVAPANFKI